MFHTREVDWSSYEHNTETTSGASTASAASVVVDTRNGHRRLLAQSPIPMEYLDHDTGVVISDARPSRDSELDNESDGYSTPDEEFGEEPQMTSCGVVRQDSQERSESSERRFFSTPCGQTYWVDNEYWLYTNNTVERPIGYWCEEDQCVYLDDGSGYSTDEDDDDDYDPPPTPPPMYEESDSVSPVPMDTNSDPEEDDMVEGETIVIGSSQ